jgi:AcrR family transcriptional regulator
LVDIAARLLAEEGPASLSARRVSAEATTSTMAVYTLFGSMGGLVREVARAGFARLAAGLDRVAWSDDPVADMALFGRVYRRTAVANANLYGVMFGGRSLGGYRVTDEDRRHVRWAMARVAECAVRCAAVGRFRRTEVVPPAHHMWLAMHGMVMLEIGDYLVGPCDADLCLEPQLVTLMVGAGDDLESATTSVRRSATRFAALEGE